VISPLKGVWAGDLKSRPEGSKKLLTKQKNQGAMVRRGGSV